MPNALAAEKSPYLQQHADNPVDWLPWGEAAFAKARAEQKPLLVSIGYSTCHWCHVMAHESFEDPAVAAVLNASFVPVKIDREERPDVDKVYMTYVQAMTGQGGWPLNVWLTPDLKPFYGGTYFPPEDRPGRPGFTSLLRAIADGWNNRRETFTQEADRVLGALRDYQAQQSASVAGQAPQPMHEAAADAFERCFLHLYESFDADEGGFGGAPKFPRASNLDFLLRVAAIHGRGSDAADEAVKMAAVTLERMARGGIHDHVGGGFHRYSVDGAWFVPHFEKMLYDQAQIAVNCLDTYRHTGDERHAWIARGILDYVLRDLAHPAGGFFSAEDADSATADGGHAEGAFYVWTHDELVHALGADAALVCDHFGVKPEGNVPPHLDPQGEFTGRNILRQTRPFAETATAHHLDRAEAADRLAAALERLRAVRALRPRPHRDEKIIAAWNGLMISAFARAAVSGAACLADKREFYRAAAVRAARFVERELYDAGTGTLHRCWRDGRGETKGFAEDHAYLAAGLIDLYEATFDVHELRWARRLQAELDARFWDAAHGGYFGASADDASIVLRLKEDYDGAEPSANSVAAANLARLADLLNEPELRARSLGTVEALRGQWSRAPHALPALLCAMERAVAEPSQVVIAGRPGAPDFEALAAVVRADTGRRRLMIAADGGEGQAWLAERAPWLADMRPIDGRAAAFVCEDGVCRKPAVSPEELRERLSPGGA